MCPVWTANLLKQAFTCQPARVQADRVELVVWDEVKRFLTDTTMAKALLEEAKAAWTVAQTESPEKKLKRKISSTQWQIEAIAERVGRLPKEFDATALITQLSKLQALKADYEKQMERMKEEKPNLEEPLAAKDFEAFRKQLAALLEYAKEPEIKCLIISKVVQKINVFEDGIEIFFHVGKSHYLRELGDWKSPGSLLSPSGRIKPQKNKTPTEYSARVLFSNQAAFQKVVGSNSLTIGVLHYLRWETER